MIPYALIISALIMCFILLPRYVGVQRGKVYYEKNGLDEFLQNSKELFHYAQRLVKHFRKISIQYTFHFLVRMLYYVKVCFDKVYSLARNSFMKQAVKDKKTVSRFWVHLKEYKQEIDKEKEVRG